MKETKPGEYSFLSDHQENAGLINPFAKSLVSAFWYIFFCTIYIWISGYMAASKAFSTEELMKIEAWKGTGFVLITGVMFFFISLSRWNRIKNSMLTIQQQNRALLISEKRATAGLCASSLAHDLNNTIMILDAQINEIEESLQNPDKIRNHIFNSRKTTAWIRNMAQRLSSLAKSSNCSSLSFINVSESFQEINDLVRMHPDLKNIKLDFQSLQNTGFHGYKTIFTQAMTNMIINSAHATGPGGHILIRSKIEPITKKDENPAIIFEVHDNGPGVSRELKDKIFDPCFTTKDTGSGLGLLSVKACAEIHNGKLEIVASELGGALFRMTLENIINSE
ncbi:MAG: hypothetical protein CVV64_14420 [Candidatus Wallbacteria bacterium HGW-Wallbacteria-1]|jgi:two-component system sensor histidine kinase HydH|uniref:histidine kinase n=1 Tax=Candidatus Wallbacteria bacterium HGW-Wallbacteria-1 TaxID=2013854 RepID=A0A2N1PM28_9BACT|nr:MAG: hypothetical protein CVV64_14420 [Candidatus Wallbacteria bacterium HGW-Wallbacteria-1]